MVILQELVFKACRALSKRNLLQVVSLPLQLLHLANPLQLLHLANLLQLLRLANPLQLLRPLKPPNPPSLLYKSSTYLSRCP